MDCLSTAPSCLVLHAPLPACTPLLSFSSDTSFLGQQTLLMFYICTVARSMQFLPLGISTKQVLKGVLHICLDVWFCVEHRSELGSATTMLSMDEWSRGKQIHGALGAREGERLQGVVWSTGKPPEEEFWHGGETGADKVSHCWAALAPGTLPGPQWAQLLGKPSRDSDQHCRACPRATDSKRPPLGWFWQLTNILMENDPFIKGKINYGWDVKEPFRSAVFGC